jgi:putative membrane protein
MRRDLPAAKKPDEESNGRRGVLHMFIWPILLIVIVVAVVWYARNGASPGLFQTVGRHPSGLDLLEERYARGEIGRDEYLQKKRDLG